MTGLRADKVAGVVRDVPPLAVDGPEGAELLVLGWGSSYGAITAAVRRARARGASVASAHLVHLNPMPANVGEVLRGARRVLVPEMNTGQLVRLLRAEFLLDLEGLSKVDGLPFSTEDLEREILARVEA
jgi:2-oxoglutarate ferredoxin oxidoreductase subunit alpha